VLKHHPEIEDVEITAAQFAFPKMFSLAQWPKMLPRGILGLVPAILVIPYFARRDRGFDFRAATRPLDRA
jgi:hypothetical protein